MSTGGHSASSASAPVVLGRLVRNSRPTPPPRYPVFGRVMRLGHEEADWVSVDMSEGGLYVQGSILYPKNSVHELQLALPHDEGAVELLCRARVAWTNGPESRCKPDLPVGMGLQFLDLDVETRERIARFVREVARQSTPRHHDAVIRYLAEFDALCQPDQHASPTAPGHAEPSTPPISAPLSPARVAALPAHAGSALAAAPQRAAALPTPPRAEASPAPTPRPSPAAPRRPLQQMTRSDTPRPRLRARGRVVGTPRRAAAAPTAADRGLRDDALTPEFEPVLELLEAAADEAEAKPAKQVVDPTQPGRVCVNGVLLEPGTVLGSYKVIRLIGSGSMGDVYLARHRKLGKLVALKRLRRDAACNPSAVRRFFQEAQRISQLNHPNIVEVIDFIEEGAERCYVMEWLPGTSLGRWRGQGEAMPARRALSVCIQLCDALALLHAEGIVHRDLKPENVMLVEREEGPDLVKLLDFSVSRFINTSTGESMLRTQTGMVLGTPGYLAPEQIVGMEIDHRCDLYALGVVMYQLFTGRKPFVASSWPELLFKHSTQPPTPPSELSPALLPEALDELVLQCLEKDPGRRPQSAAEVKARLLALEQELQKQSDDRELAPPQPPPRRSGGRVVLAAILIWLVLLGAVLGVTLLT